MRSRFKWSRKTYKHANHLSRLMARLVDLPCEPPLLLRRYWELWERHKQHDDPMVNSNVRRRLDMIRCDIPF